MTAAASYMEQRKQICEKKVGWGLEWPWLLAMLERGGGAQQQRGATVWPHGRRGPRGGRRGSAHRQMHSTGKREERRGLDPTKISSSKTKERERKEIRKRG